MRHHVPTVRSPWLVDPLGKPVAEPFVRQSVRQSATHMLTRKSFQSRRTEQTITETHLCGVNHSAAVQKSARGVYGAYLTRDHESSVAIRLRRENKQPNQVCAWHNVVKQSISPSAGKTPTRPTRTTVKPNTPRQRQQTLRRPGVPSERGSTHGYLDQPSRQPSSPQPGACITTSV